MDLLSISLPGAGADFGGVVARHLTAAEFQLVFDPETQLVMAIHHKTRKARLIHVGSGVVMEPDPAGLPAALRPRTAPPPAQPIASANGRGNPSRATR